MIRRYDLTRSDNYPATGIFTTIISGTGTFKVLTNFPTASAVITSTKTYSNPGSASTSLYLKEYLLDDGAMNFSFIPPSTVILDQIELLFSRHSSTLRDFYVKGTIQEQVITLIDEKDSLTRRVLLAEQFVLTSSDVLNLFADYA